MTRKKVDKYNHFEIGFKGDSHGFRIYADDLKHALKPVRMTQRTIDYVNHHDVLFFNDRFALPADHMKRLLKTVRQDFTVLIFTFSHDMKTVKVEIDEGRSRNTVVTFKNIIDIDYLYYQAFRNRFIWDVDDVVFPVATPEPAKPAQIEPESTLQPDPVAALTETAVTVPKPAQNRPKPPRKPRRSTPKRKPRRDWLDRLLDWLDDFADRLTADPAPSN